MTPLGLKKIQDELQHLLHIERPQIVKTVSWAAALGDRSENADYIYGKRRLREIDSRIRFLQKRLDNIDVVDPATVKSDKISFGATVTIEDEEGKAATYQIVGADEFNVSEGKISWQSPLAKSLIGKKVGDEVIVNRPKGNSTVIVTGIKYI
ncbi:MAG: transcription elongation factor GreB [Deltaproteobacteria bacterium]|nr:transcription elongation factor GreB [Deltaproteobacteria bacterium]